MPLRDRPPWALGRVTLPHVAPEAWRQLPGPFRDYLFALFWSPRVMSAFPGDWEWEVATSVMTDLAWWLACTSPLPARDVTGLLLALVPDVTALVAAVPRPVARPASFTPAGAARRGQEAPGPPDAGGSARLQAWPHAPRAAWRVGPDGAPVRGVLGLPRLRFHAV